MSTQSRTANHMQAPHRSPLRWLFENRETGGITVAQVPNLPLAIFLVAAALRMLLHPHGGVGTAVSVVATAALLWWAIAEVVRGVNPFRRLVGGVVTVATVVGLFMR
jgi:hypothetical protein